MICLRFIGEPGAVWGPEARKQKLHRILLPPSDHFSWFAAALCSRSGKKPH